MNLQTLKDIGSVSLVIGGAVYGFFWAADEVVSSQLKAKFTAWLENVNAERPFSRWPETFALLFDRIFGRKFLSFRFILCSVISTLLSSILMTIIWGLVHTEQFLSYLNFGLASRSEQILRIMGVSLFYWAIPDYLALVKTRIIIHRVGNHPSIGRTFRLLLLDALLPLVIYPLLFILITLVVLVIAAIFLGIVWLVGGKLGAPIGTQLGSLLRDSLNVLVWIFSTGPTMSVVNPNIRGILSPGILFYSMFFPSIWVWLYALAGAVVIASRRAQRGVHFLRWALDVKGHPLRVIALIAGVISILLSAVALLAVHIIRGALSFPSA